jgi:chromosomal replication initiation ATPase DnaA
MIRKKSRYKFVTHNPIKNYDYWQGLIRCNKKMLYTRCFPFTDEGERMAHEAAVALRHSMRAYVHAEALKQYIPTDLYAAIVAHLQGAAPVQLKDEELARMITETVCLHFGTNTPAVYSPSRTRTVSNARFVALYLLRELTGLSVLQIGKMFNRDHSSVTHACQTIEKRLEVETDLQDDIEAIKNKITQKRYRL